MAITVSRINITPIKGTALQQPPSVRLCDTGVAINRCFYLIDDAGNMINGKRLGQLVQLKSDYDEASNLLSIDFPDGTRITGEATLDDEQVETSFYGRPVHGTLVNDAWNKAISNHANRSLRLVRVPDDTTGADVFPVTLISQATLECLRNHANGPVARWFDRFRMMFELDGPQAFEEDHWTGRRLAIGDAIVNIIRPVPRCPVTGQNPATGDQDFETVRALHALRTEFGNAPETSDHSEKNRGKPLIGMYAEVERHGRAWTGCGVELLD